MLRRLLVLVLVVLAPSFALAQATVLQGGVWAPGHVPVYVGSGSVWGQPVIQDGGQAGGSGPNGSGAGVGASEELLVQPATPTGQGGTNWCDLDAPTTAVGGYHYLCMAASSSGFGLINYGAAGGAATQSLKMIVNGYTYTFTNSGCTGCTSDGRLKDNVKNLGSALDLIGRLRPVSFTFKSDAIMGDPGLTHYGFIAQEAGKVFPVLEHRDSATPLTPDGTLMFDYQGLEAPIVAAIQELRQENIDLRRQIAGMKRRGR